MEKNNLIDELGRLAFKIPFSRGFIDIRNELINSLQDYDTKGYLNELTEDASIVKSTFFDDKNIFKLVIESGKIIYTSYPIKTISSIIINVIEVNPEKYNPSVTCRFELIISFISPQESKIEFLLTTKTLPELITFKNNLLKQITKETDI